MAMSKRETTLAWVVGTVAALLLLDLYVIEPYFEQRKNLEELRGKDVTETRDLKKLRREETDLKAKWVARRSDGLAGDPKDAERQVLGALKDWASESGVVIA